MRRTLTAVVALAAATALVAAVAAAGPVATKQRIAIQVKGGAFVLTPLTPTGAQRYVEDVFVREANRGDYAAVCRLYSHRYLKISQAACRGLYEAGETFYGPYDYRIVRRRVLPSGHRHIDLRLHRHASFVEFARESAGWRIVAGGF